MTLFPAAEAELRDESDLTEGDALIALLILEGSNEDPLSHIQDCLGLTLPCAIRLHHMTKPNGVDSLERPERTHLHLV